MARIRAETESLWCTPLLSALCLSGYAPLASAPSHAHMPAQLPLALLDMQSHGGILYTSISFDFPFPPPRPGVFIPRSPPARPLRGCKCNAPRGVSGPRSSHRAATGPELPRPTPGAGSLDRGAHRACRAHRARSAHPQRTQAAAARLRGVSGGRRSTHRQTRLGSGSGSGPGGFGCGLGLPSSPCASQGSPSRCACGPSRAVPHRAPCIEVASCEWQVAGSK